MTDRNVQYPQRYQLQKVEGTDDIYDLIPAPGTITEEGTIINKFALLKDKTAALFSGLPENPVPDDVLTILANAALLKNGELESVSGIIIPQVKMETVSYVGTGTYTSSNPTSVTFSFSPDIVIAMYYKTTEGAIYRLFNGETSVMFKDTLSETFQPYRGFSAGNILAEYTYGKINTDGKTYFWYLAQGQNAAFQLNASGYEYYFLGIKVSNGG